MFRLLNMKRKVILFACCLVGLIAVVALTLSVQTNSQQRILNEKDKDELLKQIENSPEQSLRIVGNQDSPLQIIGAKVKVIDASKFIGLTGKTTTNETISSVPEVTLTNTSPNPITEVVLIIRNPESKSTRGFIKSKILISPGGTYTIKRQDFIKPDKLKDSPSSVEPGATTEEFWIDSSEKANLYIAIAKVKFNNGSEWMVTEGGELQ